MTIPEIEEALQKQREAFEKLSKLLSDTVENIKELRHQIGVPCADKVSPGPSMTFSEARRLADAK